MAYGNEQNIGRMAKDSKSISYDILGFQHGQQGNNCWLSIPDEFRDDYAGGYRIGQASLKGAQVQSQKEVLDMASVDNQFKEMFGA